MEIIPQKVYTYGDGLPAYKSGEWPGSRPNHFIGSKLILKPIKKFEKDFYICNSRHFPQKYSEEYKFKKSLKSIPPYIHEDIYKPKKRPLKPILTEAKIFIRNRSFNPKDNFCNPNAKEYPLLQRKKKVQNSEQTLNEYNIEEIMTRKKRIFSLDQQRNFFKTGKPGDKNYTCPTFQNVMNVAIYLSLFWGYPETYLIGVDMSSLEDIRVDQETNELFSIDRHFYNNKDIYSDKKLFDEKRGRIRSDWKLHEYIYAFGRMFECFYELKKYADYKGLKVYNASEYSWINVFERKKLK